MIVEIVAVGTELLLGQIVNSNGAEIGRRLAAAGLDHHSQQVVGDNLGRMADALRLAAGRSDAVIVTGGIGPTQDDITRDALCEVAGVEMLFSDTFAEQLRERWERRGREMPESNLRQAEYPAGAEMIDNPKGTAPGLVMDVDGCLIFALPGVPQEMLPMLESAVLPRLLAASGETRAIVSRPIRTWGESESRIAELLADLYASSENPSMAFLASGGEIAVRLTASAETAEEAETLIAPLERQVRDRLHPFVFAVGTAKVEEIVIDTLRDLGWSLATAESATGGSIALRLTGVPGASDVFRGSVVAYADAAKSQLLDVPPDVLGRGVVTEETALAMAHGARSRFDTEVAVAVTGSAGPTPREKPVGTMVIAVVTPVGERSWEMRLPGDRERVRTYATTAALHLLRRILTEA